MSRSATLERIAQLRADAKSLRESAARAERYENGFSDRRRADRLDAEANVLESELNKAGKS